MTRSRRRPFRPRSPIVGARVLGALGVALLASVLVVPVGPAAAAPPVRLTDATGERVELEAPARRVVALEWVYAEDLLTLGVTPVGVADSGGYAYWVAEPRLPKKTTDVGTRQQPSLERIEVLQPDLIIAAKHRIGGSRRELEQIAPTIVFDSYPRTGDRIEEMRSTFETIARATGKQARAQATLAGLDTAITDASARLTTAGMAGSAVALAQAGRSEGQVGARMFSDNSMAVGLLEAVGLRNGWPGKPERYGFNLADLEAMTLIDGSASFVYVPQSLDDDVVRNVFAKNPIWTQLGFVKSAHVYRLPPDTWLYGGPESARLFIERMLTQLLP